MSFAPLSVAICRNSATEWGEPGTWPISSALPLRTMFSSGQGKKQRQLHIHRLGRAAQHEGRQCLVGLVGPTKHQHLLGHSAILSPD